MLALRAKSGRSCRRDGLGMAIVPIHLLAREPMCRRGHQSESVTGSPRHPWRSPPRSRWRPPPWRTGSTASRRSALALLAAVLGRGARIPG
jgi:hypothetical protein